MTGATGGGRSLLLESLLDRPWMLPAVIAAASFGALALAFASDSASPAADMRLRNNSPDRQPPLRIVLRVVSRKPKPTNPPDCRHYHLDHPLREKSLMQ